MLTRAKDELWIAHFDFARIGARVDPGSFVGASARPARIDPAIPPL